jgi:ATP-dependent Clp protease ATP-binding subunit ClpA
MFERFCRRARSAVILAQREARDLGHQSVGTHHVLLGILDEPESVGARVLGDLGIEAHPMRDEVRRFVEREQVGFSDEDAEALMSVGIDLDEIRRTVEEAFGPGALDRRTSGGRPSRHLPFSGEAKKALELSLREAIALGHNYIGTEHLLLGLVRDEQSSASRMLSARGIRREDVRAQVLREIADGGDEPRRTA